MLRFDGQRIDIKTNRQYMTPYDNMDLEALEKLYEKAMSNGDEDMADLAVLLSSELQLKLVKQIV